MAKHYTIDISKYIRQMERERIIARLEAWGHKQCSADLVNAVERLKGEGDG